MCTIRNRVSAGWQRFYASVSLINRFVACLQHPRLRQYIHLQVAPKHQQCLQRCDYNTFPGAIKTSLHLPPQIDRHHDCTVKQRFTNSALNERSSIPEKNISPIQTFIYGRAVWSKAYLGAGWPRFKSRDYTDFYIWAGSLVKGLPRSRRAPVLVPRLYRLLYMGGAVWSKAFLGAGWPRFKSRDYTDFYIWTGSLVKGLPRSRMAPVQVSRLYRLLYMGGQSGQRLASEPDGPGSSPETIQTFIYGRAVWSKACLGAGWPRFKSQNYTDFYIWTGSLVKGLPRSRMAPFQVPLWCPCSPGTKYSENWRQLDIAG